MNDSILRLLDSLRGPEYRKAIAEVVVNDFNEEIKEIQMCSKAAKDNYSKFLGEVVVDHTRIDSIRDNLLSVFIFQARKYEYQDKASLGIANSKADGQSDGKRSRRSFFNFG